MNELLGRAFAALGFDRSNLRDLELVANAIRNSGDEEAIALLDAAAFAESRDDRDGARRALEAIATASGSNGLVALDVVVLYGGGIDALIRRSPGPVPPAGKADEPSEQAERVEGGANNTAAVRRRPPTSPIVTRFKCPLCGSPDHLRQDCPGGRPEAA